MSKLTDELTKLAALHERGILTDAEFAAQKSQLLGGGAPPDAISLSMAGPPPPGPASPSAFLSTTKGKIIAITAAGVAAVVAVSAMNSRSNPSGSYQDPIAPRAGFPSSEGRARSGAGPITLIRNAAVGAEYKAPGPRSCSNRGEPRSGPLTSAEARAYVICDNEGVTGESLILLARVQVQVSNGRPYNYVTDNYQGIDTSKTVYDIRGSTVRYACVKPGLTLGDSQLCSRVEDPNADGRCFQDANADWRCSWNASVAASTDTRLRVPPPSESEAE